MFLCSGQLQLPGDHRHHQDGAAGPLRESQIDTSTARIWINPTRRSSVEPLSHHYSSEEADAAATVGVRHHISVTDGQEGDWHHPQRLHVVATQISVVVMSVGKKRVSFFLTLFQLTFWIITIFSCGLCLHSCMFLLVGWLGAGSHQNYWTDVLKT